MEYVEGRPITQFCSETALAVEQVLRLFLEVVDAVSYLHGNLVVHRDLKPSNILVDREGHVKLLDFGIAKLLDDAEGAARTRTGELLHTPGYAAPEQLEGAPVTTATDVYALGVVLYELLTGRRPHRDDPTATAPDLPAAPSAALRSESVAEAARHVLGDLDDICLMALRPEPTARYASAEQLGQDIERHLAGLPVRASEGTLSYRAGKFARRHRRGLAVTVALLGLVAAGFVRERGLRTEAERARVEAQQQAAKSAAVSDFLAELLSSVAPEKAQGKEVTVAEVLDQAAARLADGSELEHEPSVESAVRLTVGNTYIALGRNSDAREHLERAVALRGGADSRDPEALEAIGALGVVYDRLGLHEEAEPLLRHVLEIRTETLGEEHPDSLAALHTLANLLYSEGRFDEVERLDRKTLEIRRRVLGEEHPDTLRTLNGLAATLFTSGRYAEAAQRFQQAHEIQRRKLGENHPDTLMLGNNLAAAYLELARYREAESLLREVIEGRIRVLGAEHGDTGMSLHNLGVTLVQLGRFDEAEQEFRRAMVAREEPGGGGWGYLSSACHLGDVYREQGRFPEAEELYLSVLERQRQDFGLENPNTLRTLLGLADLRIEQERLEAAEELLDELQEPLLRARGEGHPESVGAHILLARLRNEQGRFADAQQLSEQAAESASRNLGPGHPVALEAAFERARALAGQGQKDAALEVVRGVHESRATLLGESHPDTAKARALVERLSGNTSGS
jgi:tetratricopeptide (TPR) repeat protein